MHFFGGQKIAHWSGVIILIIHSKINDKQELARIFQQKDLNSNLQRLYLSQADDPLQVIGLNFGENNSVKKHTHYYQEPKKIFLVEVWIVIKGAIFGRIFDFDQTEVHAFELHSGDCLVLFRGYHSITQVQNGTFFYEIKNGAYLQTNQKSIS